MDVPSKKTAEQKRDEGIAQSDACAGLWTELALSYLRDWVRDHIGETFLCEDVREWVAKRGLMSPPNEKAWGGVMQRAKARRIVRFVGYAPARSSNMSPKVLWAAGWSA